MCHDLCRKMKLGVQLLKGKVNAHNPSRVEEPHCLHVTCQQIGSLPSKGSGQLIRDANVANKAGIRISTR